MASTTTPGTPSGPPSSTDGAPPPATPGNPDPKRPKPMSRPVLIVWSVVICLCLLMFAILALTFLRY